MPFPPFKPAPGAQGRIGNMPTGRLRLTAGRRILGASSGALGVWSRNEVARVSLED